MIELIVRGVKDVDDLAPLGLPVARRYQQADRVVLIDEHGRARAVKGGLGDLLSPPITFLDVVPEREVLPALVEAMTRVKESYEQTHPDNAHLAHATLGIWLLYWPASVGDNGVQFTLDVVAAGDIDAIRESAERFIASDFGRSATISGANGPGPADSGGRAEAADTASA